MKNRTEDIQQELEKTKAYRIQQKGLLENIQELLRKADLKRVDSPESERAHWNRVLDNLESCLDETKSRLEGNKIYIQQLERELEKIHHESPESDHSAAPAQAPATPPPLSTSAPKAVLKTAQSLLDKPIEAMGDFPLEELARLEHQIEQENLLSSKTDSKKLQARLEWANQQAADTHEDLDGPPRKQEILRNAVEKIRSNNIFHLNEEEILVIRASYALLQRRITTSPRDERLRRILGAAIQILKRKGIPPRPAG